VTAAVAEGRRRVRGEGTANEAARLVDNMAGCGRADAALPKVRETSHFAIWLHPFYGGLTRLPSRVHSVY
jgi:hypothetical protein